MKEDVEMTELALAFPLFGDSNNDTSLGKRHQVKCIDLLPQYMVWVIFIYWKYLDSEIFESKSSSRQIHLLDAPLSCGQTLMSVLPSPPLPHPLLDPQQKDTTRPP